ncbi:3-oxoacyl-ACP reductase family protein [Mollicutes bacterium LVI A0078]|nr:3-oxoacyl-ACP reductase family protein [Mollicutes bacterium LVI A0075]WOO91804.1 3-oxoacyl-ACP reductase family protein [Mollicutes bacterium LVI A0078]
MEQKIALVTGGSGGIGEATVKRLSEDGAKVYFTYSSNQGKAKQLEAEYNATAICYRFGDDATAVVSQIKDECSRLDILVNNLGVTNDKLLVKMDTADFQTVLNINVTSMFEFTKAASKLMSRKKYGRIINMSSIVGVTGNIGQANYAASKAAMIGFTKSVAKEYARKNITVNSISPGFVVTPMTDGLSEEVKAESLNRIAMKRYAEASEIASVVSFLAGDDSSYITAQNIIVDGGMS